MRETNNAKFGGNFANVVGLLIGGAAVRNGTRNGRAVLSNNVRWEHDAKVVIWINHPNILHRSAQYYFFFNTHRPSPTNVLFFRHSPSITTPRKLWYGTYRAR